MIDSALRDSDDVTGILHTNFISEHKNRPTTWNIHNTLRCMFILNCIRLQGTENNRYLPKNRSNSKMLLEIFFICASGRSLSIFAGKR